MAILDKPQREAMAQALADGATQSQASAKVGYKKKSGQVFVKRMAKPDLIARVAEIKRERALAVADLEPVIEALMAAAKTAATLKSAAAFEAIRGLLVEAARLKGLLQPPAAATEPRLRTLPDAEWDAKYKPRPDQKP
jgi:hypothetical protein